MMDKMIPANEAASLITHLAAWEHAHMFTMSLRHIVILLENVSFSMIKIILPDSLTFVF